MTATPRPRPPCGSLVSTLLDRTPFSGSLKSEHGNFKLYQQSKREVHFGSQSHQDSSSRVCSARPVAAGKAIMSQEAEDAVLIVAGLCSAFAVGLSSLLIRRHLMHFSRPVVQVGNETKNGVTFLRRRWRCVLLAATAVMFSR